MTNLLSCLLFLLTTHVAVADPTPLLHSLFQDHVVLQRDQPIRVWGRATAGDRIEVSLAGASQTARADASGRWSLSLPALAAGGPYSMSARGGSGATQTVQDILIGDVWLCSGQSNMELQVHRALDARAETANAANDRIRFMTIPKASNGAPLDEFSSAVQWRVAAPATVPDFSATCLYFAREVQKTVDAPMGLIAAAWGGSKIETWMSEAALRATGRHDAALDVLALHSRDPLAAHARWGALWESWWRERTGDRVDAEPWSRSSQGVWRSAPQALGPWEKWGVRELESYNGMLWYRTTIRLSPQQAAQAATLSLGLVDEVDQTWINGRPIGAGFRGASSAPVTGPGPERTYHLPRGALQAGENHIVVNVLDTYATGGLHGPAGGRALRFADGAVAPLDREWSYQLPPAGAGTPPRAPWEAVAGLSVVHNAMIAPLATFGLRGVVWYQGESNTEDAAYYQDLLARWMADWRDKFGASLPFLIVQLANYGPPPTAPVESGWAELREAQRLAVAHDAHAGLAVAIDIGDRYDIHPANKQEVGRRLARAARHVVYGEALAPSGPIPVAARKEGAHVVVSFSDVATRLMTYSAEAPIGFELCGAARGSCRYATATIASDRVVLDAGDFPAASKVRYCWADSPVCTLFDEARLPAGPFQMEIQ